MAGYVLLLAACSGAPATGGVRWGRTTSPRDLYGDPYTGSKVYFAQARAVEKLEEARDAEMHVIVRLAGWQEHYLPLAHRELHAVAILPAEQGAKPVQKRSQDVRRVRARQRVGYPLLVLDARQHTEAHGLPYRVGFAEPYIPSCT